MKSFLIVTDDASVGERNIITNYVKGKGYAFWHYFEDIWLLANVPDAMTAGRLHQEIGGVLPLANYLIFETTRSSFHGRVPEDSFKWMQTYWNAAKK